MLLMLDNSQKEHLSFLSTVTPEICHEFGKISINFLKKGINPKIYHTAAQKLGVDESTVRESVEGLMFLFVESVKMMLTDSDFQDTLLALGFSEELQAELLTLYQENRNEIRKILSQLSLSLPQYQNLEWRLDVEIASRSLRNQINPSTTLKLTLKNGETETVTNLQTDPLNLIHLTEELDHALQEMKTQHCRRITRLIK